MTWHAIWENGTCLIPAPADPNLPLAGLTLHLELVGPKVTGALLRRGRAKTPIRLWQGLSSTAPISIYLMPDGALRLLHGPVDVSTEAGALNPGETVLLRYIACAFGRSGGLSLMNATQGTQTTIPCREAQRPTLGEALPAVRDYLGVAHVAAVAGIAQPFIGGSAIAAGARVATPEGLTPIEHLAPGDLVLDPVGRAVPLEVVAKHQRLCLGRAAPLQLCAPYFGLRDDVTVTPETRILQTGATVDYVCGTDSVLVRARDLISGRAVRADGRAAVQDFYRLQTEGRICVMVNGCPVETARPARDAVRKPTHPHPALADRAMARAILGSRSDVA